MICQRSYRGMKHSQTYVDIALVQTRHRDSPVSSQVDVRFLGECVNLLRFEPGEAEHAWSERQSRRSPHNPELTDL